MRIATHGAAWCMAAGLLAGSAALAADAAEGAKQPVAKVTTGAKPAAAGGWAAVARWPDFMTGMWAENYNYGGRVETPLTAEAKAQIDKLPKNGDGDGARCLPLGMPDMMGPGLPMAFFFTRGMIFIMSDMDDLQVRRIHMDRSTHGEPDPSYYGDSIGHWEGQTLVIDTSDIVSESKLSNLPSNGKTHIVERIRLTGPNALEWKISVTNPDILAKPWEKTHTYVRHADWQLAESSCTAGNRDTPAANGSSQVDLTPRK
ncbi:MAG: hypothetical protein QM718_06510 [Steroidobacteraceae bacterium]